MRKLVAQSVKQHKKKIAKNMRVVRDFTVRAKKMQREVAIFWRKRGRELSDLKKRKEKLENEIKKRDEERRESELYKKRLAFLMKQSDIYAHFMAKKLGIHTNSEETPADPNELNQEFKDVEIDEDQALANVTDMINNQRKQTELYDHAELIGGEKRGRGAPKIIKEDQALIDSIQLQGPQVTKEELKEDYKPFDFSNVRIEDSSQLVQTPKSFLGNLKEYQLKGLRWLDNLYEQGINGILADEMGLGKTIQAIALLSHISEKKGNWGPFLIVAPSSTLHNWINEVGKFCPSMKLLPYWGGVKERKILRKYFVQHILGKRESSFHICVTSYNIAVADEKAFCRIRWQHIILDEAQQIKNINSQRWKTLMSFKSRNKLLLTGTPLQNNMAELWALLHFIMPKLFDSHEQFQEWFSKDIEASSTSKDTLNHAQLNRLHAILKPFMLRRVKKDVEKEIGKKHEYQIKCELTQRQKDLYNSIKNKLSYSELFQMLESKSKVKNLMNLVMQFRKVCNHPELFERRQKRASFVFTSKLPLIKNTQPVYGVLKLYSANLTNPISFEIPRLVFHELMWFNEKRPLAKYSVHEDSLLYRLLDMDRSQWLMHFNSDLLICYLVTFHAMKQLGRQAFLEHINDLFEHSYNSKSDRHKKKSTHDHTFNGITNHEDKLYGHTHSNCKGIISLRFTSTFHYYGFKESKVAGSNFCLPKSTRTLRELVPYRIEDLKIVSEKVCAPQIDFTCADYNFERMKHQMYYNPWVHYALYGHSRRFLSREFLPRVFITNKELTNYFSTNDFHGGLLNHFDTEFAEQIVVPSFESLIADSAKLRYLDKLLAQLKAEGHRVLIFCQMTKMMNLLEEYLTKRNYSYFRLDGNTSIGDRNQMVKEYQNNKEIFAFILSTRAGGLGITLTAADTVIFYDNDWNPTMDAQATDRAHRIGQINDVSVYR
jgi:DNA helicase INO80